MQTRTIVISAGAAIAAFAVAFGIGKAAGGGDSKASTAAPAAKTIDVQSATISTNLQTAGLPPLKAKPKPKATPTPTPEGSVTPTPTTTSSSSTSSSTTSSNTTTNTSPPPANNSNPDDGPVTGGQH